MPETKFLFNKIAKHYDLLNSVFSLGIDKLWRKKLAKEVSERNLILDIATGTAEVAIETARFAPHAKIVGIDPSTEMLKIGEEKIIDLDLDDQISLREGYGEKLPFEDNTFDAITIAFGIRNTLDFEKSLAEMLRVLKPGGKVSILEFAIPSNFVFKPIYLFYFKYIMPLIGSIFGSKNEYKYLSDSTTSFPQRKDFINILKQTGFNNTSMEELTMGISIIYTGIK